tara:strand:+ start:8166 stop:9758 length:1593 start_codon:yes stop_codon:yes gene_type:complete
MAEDMSPRLGVFGDPVASTPNLDQLAERGVMYSNTYTTAGVCAPSRAAHILGRHQMATGTQHMRTTRGPLGTYRSVPPADAKAYPELLRAAGYYTYTDDKLDYQFSGPLAGSGPFTIWDEEGANSHWRKRGDGQAFFGFVNFQVTHESGVFRPLGSWPHGPLHFVMQLARAWRIPDIQPARSVLAHEVPLPPYYPDTPTVRADVARHYNNIGVMDRQVGAILQQLEQDGLAESTIVIWTTDHGDGLPRAKRELFDSGIHVPLIIYWPEAYRPDGVAPGSVDERLISFVDLAPTILSLAGVTVPDGMPGLNLVSGPQRQYVFAARDRIDEIADRQRAVRDSRYKYIRSWQPRQPGGHALAFRDNIDMMRQMHTLYAEGKLNAVQRQWFEPPGEERLFDTLTDPHELHDLSADAGHARVLERMRGALDAWLNETPDLSEISEAEMLARFQPQGETPVTPPPRFSLSNGRVVLGAEYNASIGYRINGGDWQLYSQPMPLERRVTVHAKAVRYGWEESDEISFVIPVEPPSAPE